MNPEYDSDGIEMTTPSIEHVRRFCADASREELTAEVPEDTASFLAGHVVELTAARDKLAAECEDLRKQSESWRMAHFAWQQWGDRMRQLVACTLNGDEPTREAIEHRALSWRDQRDSASARALKAETDRDRLRAEVERLAAERDADVANLRAGHCLAVIPETFIACGEGGSYCSETCRLRTLLAEAVEIGQRLAGLECDSAAEERLAAIAKEGLT